jgi:hypothetical protein
MHMSYNRYEALEELFRYCEEHGIDAEVKVQANIVWTVHYILPWLGTTPAR